MSARGNPTLNRWVIEQDIREYTREGKKPLFAKLDALPRGTIGTSSNLFYVSIPGEHFGLSQPIKLDIPRCAQVYLGRAFERLVKGDEPVQLLAAGFKDNELTPAYLSLLRAQDIRDGTAALILLPHASSSFSSSIYAELLRNSKSVASPSYHPVWQYPFSQENYPIRTQDVKELEERLGR